MTSLCRGGVITRYALVTKSKSTSKTFQLQSHIGTLHIAKQERLQRLINLWIESNGASEKGYDICKIACARIEKYSKRGYSFIGLMPPKKWAKIFPPWLWGTYGKRIKINEQEIMREIKKRLLTN